MAWDYTCPGGGHEIAPRLWNGTLRRGRCRRGHTWPVQLELGLM